MISLKPEARKAIVKHLPKAKLAKFAVIAAVVAVLAGLIFAGFYMFQKNAEEAAGITKNTVLVKRGPAEIVVQATGVIRPDREVKISPKQSGLLKSLLVKQGDFVRQGEIVAYMDDSNLTGEVVAARGAYLASLDNFQKMKAGNRPQEVAMARFQEMKARDAKNQAERNMNRLQAQLEALRAQLKREQTFAERQSFLAKQGAVSDQASMDAITQSQVAQAQLKAAEQERKSAEAALAQSESDLQSIAEQHELARSGFRAEDISAAGHSAMQAKGQLMRVESLLEDTRIRAPFDGIITQKYTDAGAIVTPTTSAATTSATSSSIVALAGALEMVAQVSESNIPKVTIGQPVEITATAYPDKVFHGRVRQIAPAAIVTQNVTTFEVHVLPTDDKKRQLLAGMNVNAKFLVGKIENALTVPTVAVITRRGKTGVFVPDSKGEPTFKPVKTGTSTGRDIVILEGLKENDKVFLGLSRDQLSKEGYSRGGPPGGMSGSPLRFGGGGRGMRGMDR